MLTARLAPGLDALARALEPDVARAVPPRARRFLTTWRVRAERVTAATSEPALAAAAFAVAEAIPALDELAFALRRSSMLGVLHPLLGSALEAIVEACRGSGVAWLPALAGAGATRATIAALESEAGTLGVDPSIALETLRVASRQPAGTVVAIERRGLLEGGRLVQSARVHVASGLPPGPRAVLLEAAFAALEAARPQPDEPAPRARQTEALARLAREIDRADEDDAAANAEASLRFALLALERSGAIPEARRAVLAFLQARGVVALALEPGTRFDSDRHPPALYECRRTAGTPGVVVATLETGFRDARGAVLAPAVVLVGR